MLEASFYYPIYLIVVTIFTIILSVKYSYLPNKRLSETGKKGSISALVLTVALIIFIGLRPRNRLFVDMSNYHTMFYVIKRRFFHFELDSTNYIFDNFFNYLATHGFELELFFFLMAAMYFFFMYLASKKMFPKDTLYALVIYLAAFSTFSYGTNGIKAGVAASLFLCALAYIDKRIICGIFLIASLGFHHSMIVPIAAFLLSYFVHKPKLVFYIWILCVIIAALKITFIQNFFANMADESGAIYLAVKNNTFSQFVSGFRLDFIIYSFAPIWLGYYIIVKKKYESKVYNIIYSTYVITNAVWLLCMYASFTNRIAYLSWLILPFVLIYPFFDKAFIKKQYTKLNYVVWGQLLFTIFMNVVYYGFLKS